ncbi:hypothetical protein SDC9_14831 [bioreactor metagenome]|jgi:hypothetical protein|uniref:Uncharacterized protein n=1 Tax=bioreactor metagenome TaxID=1076179 RepID=A0A644TQ31_9ZZZZ|nr:hypothetical protein [Lentimicrobium sp.]MEA5108926.1 hypothetical protein [Lentimicrobium sp.]
MRKALAILLLLPSLWLITNGLINRHAHRMPSGLIVEHAHPFKSTGNTPLQKHSHSEEEYFYFDQISTLQTMIIVAIIILMATVFIKPLNIESDSEDILPIIYPVYRLRPPPTF